MPPIRNARQHALCLISGLLLALAPATSAKPKEKSAVEEKSMATYLLGQLNEREQEAYKRYDTALAAGDVDRVKQELQSIIDGYESLIGQAPDFAPAYISYGLMLNRTGNDAESYAMFLKADQLDPMVPVVKNQLGNYMAETGKYNEALGFFMLAHDLAPKESLYDYQIGQLLVAYRKFFIDDKLFTPKAIDEKILSHFKRAMKNSPDDSSFRMRYAQAFFDVSNPNWEDALEAWQTLYKYAGSEYEQQIVRLYTARVRYELGHFTAARKLLEKIDHPSLEESKATIVSALNEKYPE